MVANASHVFTVDDISTGAFAHGFGDADDGRSYAFQVIDGTLVLEVYRSDLGAHAVPSVEDIVATGRMRVTDVDVTDERSLVGMVRDMLANAQHVADGGESEGVTIRAMLQRIGSLIDAI